MMLRVWFALKMSSIYGRLGSSPHAALITHCRSLPISPGEPHSAAAQHDLLLISR